MAFNDPYENRPEKTASELLAKPSLKLGVFDPDAPPEDARYTVDVDALAEAVGGRAVTRVERIRPDGQSIPYKGSDGSPEQGGVALRAAMADAIPGDKLRIVCGFCASGGTPFTTSLPDDWPVWHVRPVLGLKAIPIIFPDTSTGVLYGANPEHAGEDCLCYEGKRNPLNFGADGSRTYEVDSWPAFQAALYSLPPYGNGNSYSESVPMAGNSLPQRLIRTGCIQIPMGSFWMSQPFYINAYMAVEGMGSRSILWFAPNLAPTEADKKPAFGVLRSFTASGYAYNWTHNVRASGFAMVTERLPGGGLIGNDWLWGGYMGGAQNCVFEELAWSGFGFGVVLGRYSDYVDFRNNNIGRIHYDSGLILSQCNLCTLYNNSFTDIAPDGSSLDGQGRPHAAIRMDGCESIAIIGTLMESGVRLLAQHGCHNTVIISSEHLNYADDGEDPPLITPHPDAVTIDSYSSTGLIVMGARATFVTALVRVNGAIKIPGSGATYAEKVWKRGSYTQEINSESITARALVMPETSPMSFVRADANRDFVVHSTQSDSNPALVVVSRNLDGTSMVEHLNFARANGGIYTGFRNRFVDGFFDGGVNTESTFRVNRLPVVGARGLPIADPAGGATVDAEARAAIAALLAHFRSWGSIAT